jgi:hypothetical protein
MPEILDVHEIGTSKKTSKKVSEVSKEVSEVPLKLFNKDQILSSERYKHRKDVVNVVLNDSRCYTLSQVDDLIQKFMTSEVK